MRDRAPPGPAPRRGRAASLIAAVALTGCEAVRPQQPAAATTAQRDCIMMTVVYDNNPGREGLRTAWGFACIVAGPEKTILFDTGGDGPTLLANMKALGVDPAALDAVVLSHPHGDHTGGLVGLLEARPPLQVIAPTGCPAALREEAARAGGRWVEAAESVEICPGARTTGTLGRDAIPEHALCVRTGEGWVLITGCAHPGVANLAAAGAELVGGRLHAALGGFHMRDYAADQVSQAIGRLRELGVTRVAPCHCTGDPAREIFKREFGDACELIGVGAVLDFPPPGK